MQTLTTHELLDGRAVNDGVGLSPFAGLDMAYVSDGGSRFFLGELIHDAPPSRLSSRWPVDSSNMQCINEMQHSIIEYLTATQCAALLPVSMMSHNQSNVQPWQ